MGKQILTLISWNVNGIRAAMRKDFLGFLKKHKPDILALQEVKIAEKNRGDARLDFPGYTEFWNSADRPGYSGTAILIKENLAKNIKDKFNDIGKKEYDTEGRAQTIEFDNFYLMNIYFPNTREDLSRLDFKIDFNNQISKFVKKLEKNKPVILTGDFNVAHEEIDLARPKPNEGNAGFHPRERDWMTKFLESGMIDTFRYLNSKKIQYSWWTYRFGARSRNVGWRIDYFITSKKLARNIKQAKILDQVLGSDHCPVLLKIEI
jgi:exodeoxyribonuclease III